ncbi:glucose-inhibited division protein A [Vulcanisaeta distributa DSM 14429]|uniref:Glucose-inhibited division protein A n=1 Tax=Vulcanisaeta distributa (strain DSM 14429 / JCM 11212 / NBRC 100878 / IC-017) TaxID=572478 RepID=E1QQ76_VULDI|nr:NAD(P)/FAD-dependent oxidoreductase [Vulcanisaeta distributa]ADN51563.1 glucose-inhibited division protein A [Vulcanisaeta distributa DSM 14429]
MVDVVIIGAGHNGLVASIILARAGLEVLVLDHVTWPGGLAGYHVVGGVEVPIGAYVLGLIPSDLMSELGINVEQYKPEPIAVYVKDGEFVRWWRSLEDRVREFNRWGLGDNLRAMWSKIVNFHKALRKYMFRLNPPSRDELLNDSVLSEFIKLRGWEFLSQYLPREFWDMFIFEPYLDQPAFMVGYYNPDTDWWFPAKDGEVGMQVFARELYNAALRAGAKVVLGLGVRRIIVEGGRVRGVITDDGRSIEARAVLSTASPINTLINLVGEEYFDKSVIDRLRSVPLGGASRLVIVSNEPIKLRGELNNYRNSILQLPFGETVVHGNYLIVTGLPTRDELGEYFDIDWSSIKAFELITPSDYESIFRLAGGNLNHLPMTEDYMFSNRPIPGWGYSTPIRGLYLGGAGTWPGGQVTGVPGYNAARKILSDWSSLR